MSDVGKVNSYFDSKAEGYDARRGKGLLGKIVLREMRSAMELLNARRGERILDCGCGSGSYGDIIRKKGASYLGIDVSERMVAEAVLKGLDARRCSMEDFKTKALFDKIIISGSLEFCEDPLYAVKRCVRNLKRNGSLVIVAPRRSLAGLLYKAFHLSHGISIRLFSEDKLIRIMGAAGISRDSIDIKKPHNLVFVISGRKNPVSSS